MALPIKPKDTQEGCNPISSNCIIWQGPDIPCINLCNGDSVSDVVAKLAEELCTIVDQLDISLLDISCFGALAPEPADFRDVIQLLIDRICNLEAGSGGGGGTSAGCPDDCLVSVAECLRTTDALGNVITELPLRDYMILIANRLCTLIGQINTLSAAVTDLQNRVTVIENTISNPADNSITVTSGGCIGRGVPTPIVTFVIALETELCNLVAAVGTPTEINIAISQQCIVDGLSLDAAPQLSDSGSSMSNIPGWIAGASYNTLADAVNNLWLTVCDMRTAIAELQTNLAACCAISCNDVDWNFTASGLANVKFVTLLFTGDIPSGFNYCAGGTTTPITINNSVGQTGNYQVDVITAVNTGAPVQVALDSGGNTVGDGAIWYQVRIPLCVTNGDISCTADIIQSFYNTAFCANRGFSLSVTGLAPSANISVSFTPSLLTTQYTMRLYQITGGIETLVATLVQTIAGGGLQTYSFGASFSTGTYICRITAMQTPGVGQPQYTTDPACATGTVSVAPPVLP